MSGAPQGRVWNFINFTGSDIRMDHRNGRRNRATQSCLHCHTNKRKCDRKRPCQRCIQMGMTGLCIYEVEDPDARHDPNVVETTRLRNRIAELETLVRELRGKPHPRWTNALSEQNRSELWHSGRHSQDGSPQKLHAFSHDSAPVQFPISNEPISAVEHSEYRNELPPSPFPIVGGFEQHSLLTRSGAASFDSQASDSPTSQSSNFNSPCMEMHIPPHCPTCACLANPSTRASLEFLASQIQGTLYRLEKLPDHDRDSQCPIYQIIELNSILCNGLQSARFDGHPNLTTSHDRELPGVGNPHALEEMQLWSSSQSEDGYSPYISG